MNIKHLGVGISYRPQFHKSILSHKDKIDFLEVIADGYFRPSAKKELDILVKHYPLVFHGIEKSIGNTKLRRSDFIHNMLDLGICYSAPWLSLHCARTGGMDFIPLAFTERNVSVVKNACFKNERFLRTDLILENISYDTVDPKSTMSEIEFFNLITKESNVKFLFDVTNLYHNAINHDYDPFDFINRFPLDRIVQVHFTGGNWSNGKYVDTHSSKTPEHVWDLMEYLIKKTDIKGIVLERDDKEAVLEDLIPELERAKKLLNKR